MAKVTAKTGGVTFVLELDEAEAQYVHAALQRADPVRLDRDGPYEELSSAMDAAGVSIDLGAARG